MTDKENCSDEGLALAGFSDDTLVRELERRRRAARDRCIERRRIIAEGLLNIFTLNPEVAAEAGVNLQGEFGTALNNPEDYQFRIMATYTPER